MKLFLNLFCLFVLLQFGQSATNVEQVTFTPEGDDIAGSCSVYKGYDIRPGFDLDMTYFSSNSECCQLCFRRADCKGWTMYEEKCHLKGTNELVVARDPKGTVSGLRNEPGTDEAVAVISDAPPRVESPKDSTGKRTTCSVLQDTEIVGEDLGNLGYMFLSECCHQCGQADECTGWTYHEWECILKTGTQLGPKVGDISGLKLAAIEPPEQATPDVAPASD